ncbi:MAG TPA: Rpn family recombination-promoting nuclease/putative transposase [Thermoanaerobaculia bacterium]|nr:Rpn family recombination-promoting nuclease/putative transposase [Thermoanaerobaculia bacterium]
MTDNDRGYKLLFSHPRMVRDLLRGFIRGGWISRLDFTSLERVSGSSVDDGLRERHNDVTWRLRWADGEREGWFYVLLEFQSAPQSFMALRLVVYAALLLQTLIRTGRLRARQRLPTVLPVVLYIGRRPWRALRQMADLFAPVHQDLRRHHLGLEYVLVDGTGIAEEDARENLVAALLRIEACRTPAELAQVAADVAALLSPEEADLRRAFAVWMKRVLHRISPGATISVTEDLEETTMLEENLREWHQRGLRRSHKKGLEEGLVQGAQRVVLRQIKRRFGPVPRTIQTRIKAITSVEELERLAEKVVTAGSLQELGFA